MPERAPRTILVVDDEVDMRTLVRVAINLANHGLSIVGEASDGIEALATWRALYRPAPDVVVLDNRMPGLTGIEAAEQILAEWPGQVIVLYSAFLDEEVRTIASAVGISACVSKEDISDLPGIIWELTAA